MISDLLSEPGNMFESSAIIRAALNDCRQARVKVVSGRQKSAGFADALPGQIAGYRRLALTAVYTFDKAALSLPGVKCPG